MRLVLEHLLHGHDLDEAGAGALLDALTHPDVSDAIKAGLLVALRAKGETGTELRGMALAMRGLATPVPTPAGRPVVDTCGTGGDASSSFNISTAVALVAAAGGLAVAKHGNRSVSSRCGSADVLEHLGAHLAADADTARRQLDELGFTFLFAPSFHPATAGVAAVRRALGVRTAFNLLGPLTNPAAPTHQLVGAASPQVAHKLADALSGMPVARAFVVHGAPSWDEATPCGPFLRLDVTPGRVIEHVVDPEAVYGLARAPAAALAGGDVDLNADIVRAVLAGAWGAPRDVVLLNAALVFELVDPALTPVDALAKAAEVVDSGRAAALLDRLAGWR